MYIYTYAVTCSGRYPPIWRGCRPPLPPHLRLFVLVRDADSEAYNKNTTTSDY